MGDHTPVLFNVFEDWNEESVVPHISFDSIRIRFERKRQIRRSLSVTYLLCGRPNRPQYGSGPSVRPSVRLLRQGS